MKPSDFTRIKRGSLPREVGAIERNMLLDDGDDEIMIPNEETGKVLRENGSTTTLISPEKVIMLNILNRKISRNI